LISKLNKTVNARKLQYFFLTLLALVPLTVPLWLKVGLLPMRMWDEARNAVNAIEMYQTHEWLVRTYNFIPETYELKPPLLTWFQVGSLNLFGVNELGIRMPSVAFSIITLLLLSSLLYKMTKNFFLGVLAAAITATSAGFYAEHAGRFGDHEALLVCICTWLFYNVYMYSTTECSKYIYLTAISVALGVLCKSVTIGMVLPGIVLFLFYDKKILQLIKNKHSYLALGMATLPIFLYYSLREQAQPGYLNLVWHGELLPRFMNTSSHLKFDNAKFTYYFELLKSSKMEFWVWSFILIAIAPIFTKRFNRKWMFWTIQSLVFLIILSFGTKNFWYIAPTIPMLAGAVTISVHQLIKTNVYMTVCVSLFLLILTTLSYQKAYNYAFHPTEEHFEWETNGISHYLKDEDHLAKVTSGTKILLDGNLGYQPHDFYLRKLSLEKGLTIERTELYHLKPNDTLLISHQSTLLKLKKIYSLSIIDSSYSHTKLLSIHPLVQIDSISDLSSVE
jgi:4-amino-4-deoxy-L-arabinose transferase-like glycosyltransferase